MIDMRDVKPSVQNEIVGEIFSIWEQCEDEVVARQLDRLIDNLGGFYWGIYNRLDRFPEDSHVVMRHKENMIND